MSNKKTLSPHLMLIIRRTFTAKILTADLTEDRKRLYCDVIDKAFDDLVNLGDRKEVAEYSEELAEDEQEALKDAIAICKKEVASYKKELARQEKEATDFLNSLYKNRKK